MPSTETNSAVLDALAANPGATAAEVAVAAGVGRSTAAKSLAALVADGRVLRQGADRSGGRRRPDRFTFATTPKAKQAGRARLPKGELRALVLNHLRSRPGEAVSPTAAAKALGRSTGAVGNALERLAASGEVVQASTTPRRYAAS